MRIDRRTVLASSGGALALGLVPAAAWAAPTIPKPPVAKAVPFTETLFDTTLSDPYRWMEDARDPDWLPFLKGQDATTRATLAAIPGRAALLARVKALSGEAAITTLAQRAGERTFFQQRPAGADNYKLFVREGGTDRVLVDPTVLGTAEAHVSIDWWAASPDGTHVFYGLSKAGSEDSTGQVMVVATGEILPERIPNLQYASPTWLNDGSGFFYNQLTGTKGQVDYYQRSRAMLHRLRTDPATDLLVMQAGKTPGVTISDTEFPGVSVTPGSDVALALLFNGVQNEITAFTAPAAAVIAGKAAWRKVCDARDNVTSITLRGSDLHLLSNAGAIRGRVLKTPALAPDLKTATVVLPMGAMVVEAIAAARDGVYARMMDGGVQRLKRIAPDGTVADVALPYDGSIQYVFAATDSDGVLLNLTGWVQPSAIHQVDATTLKASDTGINPLPPIDLAPYVATRLFATAKDGVKVPVTVVARRDTPKDGRRPTIVEAYGAYQYAQGPSFRARTFAFLDAGGVYAVAGVRGGGEYGREWHEGGRLATKPNTWRDLIACCETLVSAKWTGPKTLAILGGSAGGITVGRAMTERPDLFAAVVSLVGTSNTLRMEFSPNGPANIPEFGTVTQESGFRALLAMDSVKAVKTGTRYPAVLLTTGATDPRVASWQIGKMTAALQAATASGKPVLMRVDFDAGHGLGSTRAQADAENADIFSFVLWQSGTKGFQPA